MRDEYILIHSWIMEILICVWNMFLVISLLTKLYVVQKTRNATKPKKLILYSAIASFLGFPICYTAKLIIHVINPTENHYIRTLNISVTWFSFAVSRLAFYVFMISRLYYSFYTSAHKISNRMLKAHTAIICIIPFYIGAMILLQELNVPQQYYIIGSILCVATLLCGSLHILYVFSHKLYRVIADASCANNTTQPSTDLSGKTCTVTVPQFSNKLTRKLFVIVVKNAILTCVTMIMFIFIIILYGVFLFYDLDQTVWTILSYVQVMAVNTASLCIYLSFGVNSKLYSMCCSMSQSKCELICNYLVEKHVQTLHYKHVRSRSGVTPVGLIVIETPGSTPIGVPANATAVTTTKTVNETQE
eukprot:26890_1